MFNYFKGRTDEELNVVVKRLDIDKTKYKIFQYGIKTETN